MSERGADLFNEAHDYLKKLRTSHTALSGYKVKSKGKLQKVTDSVNVIIEVQKSKYWPADQRVAFNIFVGLKWRDGELHGPDGWAYQDMRLSEQGVADHWWDLVSDDDLTLFREDVDRLLPLYGLPFIESCSTHEGAYQWMVDQTYPVKYLKYSLLHFGREEFIARFQKWLDERPRSVDKFFDWVERKGVFEKGQAELLKKKSWQALETYEEFLRDHQSEFV